jgi:hypothetical protein
MICKSQENNINALLRLKSREDLAVQCIQRIASEQNNQNKIASVQYDTGEVTLAEFVKLLRSVIPSS